MRQFRLCTRWNCLLVSFVSLTSGYQLFVEVDAHSYDAHQLQWKANREEYSKLFLTFCKKFTYSV